MKSVYLSANLYNKLYAHMTYDNVLILRIALETGMRVGDVVALQRRNLQKRTLNYVAQKTGKRDKKSISQGLYNLLIRQLNSDLPSEYFFKHRTKKGEHRTRQAVWKNVKKACTEIGLDINVTPHSARKTYAVEEFHDKGLTITQKELQHDNPSTTVLYAFSDVLVNEKPKSQKWDFDILAEKIAVRVVELLGKKYFRNEN